jgi:hypothetical protein
MEDSIPDLVPTWFLFDSYLVPTQFLALMPRLKFRPLATSKWAQHSVNQSCKANTWKKDGNLLYKVLII